MRSHQWWVLGKVFVLLISVSRRTAKRNFPEEEPFSRCGRVARRAVESDQYEALEVSRNNLRG